MSLSKFLFSPFYEYYQETRKSFTLIYQLATQIYFLKLIKKFWRIYFILWLSKCVNSLIYRCSKIQLCKDHLKPLQLLSGVDPELLNVKRISSSHLHSDAMSYIVGVKKFLIDTVDVCYMPIIFWLAFLCLFKLLCYSTEKRNNSTSQSSLQSVCRHAA